jgi:phenylacetic acid degradation operon negative regulatory protein
LDLKARSALFTLFGDVVRPAGGDAWLTTLTTCMGALGFTPEATRTALHRMAAEGWVAPRRSGRYSVYSLTDAGVERLEEAAARIYRLRAADWDGRWHLLVCPAAGRSPEIARELQWTGHGRLSGDVWVSPHPQGRRLARLLDAHDLDDLAVQFDSVTTTDAAQSRRIVSTAWDLTELRTAHQTFIEQWADADAPDEPQAAFATRIRLVHHWRSFLFMDPGLPAELLPADWLGDAAARVFRSLYEAVDTAAWRYYDGVAQTAPPSVDITNDAVRTLQRTAANPFVHGLDALSTPRPA